MIINDPNYGKLYVFVGALCDKADASGIAFLTEHNIPIIVAPRGKYVAENPESLPDCVDLKIAYFLYYGKKIKTEYDPHIILCSGFMKIIPEPFLKLFPNRILNVHPADLSVKDLDTGERLFTGADAVAKAYNRSVKQMRSTIHIVTTEVDGGPIVALSPAYDVNYHKKPAEIQEIMKIVCDGPAGKEALEKICKSEKIKMS